MPRSIRTAGRPSASPSTNPPRVSEKALQQQIVQFLTRGLGGRVYVSGTRRRKGDFQGTMQTPGIPDLEAFLPLPPRANPIALGCTRLLLKVEVKADRGRLSPDQEVYRDLCKALPMGVYHVVGGLNDVLAWAVRLGYIHTENVPHYRRASE